MRLVRFEDESGGFAVDLHPLITVISGLPAHVRERLVHGLASLPRGTDPGGRGSIEVHGVFLDLNRESLELLELNQDLDVILRSSDLPGAAAADDPSADDAELDLAGGSDDEEVVEARRLAQQYEDAYERAVQAVEMFRVELADIEREQQALGHELSDARSGLDSFAAAGLKIAREELAELVGSVALAASPGFAEPFVAPVPSADDLSAESADESGADESGATDSRAADSDGRDVEADRVRIEARLTVLIDDSDRLKRLVKSLRAIDPEPVRRAFAALEGAAGTTTTTSAPSPEAQELADAWQSLQDELGSLEPPRDEGRELLDSLTSQRDAAYDALKLAERNLRAPELDPAAIDRLESIHDEIFELDGRTSRFGAGKVRRRLETLRAEEAQLLEALGFDTWSSYIMGITSAGADPARRREHERAQAAYEFAEQQLADAAADPLPAIVDHRRADLEARRIDLQTRIAFLLGTDPGDDPVPALRAVSVEVTQADAAADPTSDPDAAATALRLALEDTGAEMPPGTLSITDLRSLAAGWLETMSELPQRIAEATAQRDEIEVEISDLAVELEALPEPALVGAGAPVPHPATEGPSPEAPAPDAPAAERQEFESAAAAAAPSAASLDEDSPEIVEARGRVEEGEARVQAHERAVARIAEIEGRHAHLVARSHDVHRSLAEREPQVASLLEQRVAARNRLRRAETNRGPVEGARWDARHHVSDEPSRYLGGSAGAEAVEWYVLARLAQQRSVSFVGSVPLVIDDAFANWPVEALGDVFTRLERMGEVIQIVYLTDDPEVGAWARSLGADRALVLDMRVAS